jgi:hypothetical protein
MDLPSLAQQTLSNLEKIINEAAKFQQTKYKTKGMIL